MIFSYINRPVDRVVAISVDGLFTLPEFKINEKVFHLLLEAEIFGQKILHNPDSVSGVAYF